MLRISSEKDSVLTESESTVGWFTRSATSMPAVTILLTRVSVVRGQGDDAGARSDIVGPIGSWSSRGDAGSSDKQAKAKVRHFEIEEVAVAFGPPTGCEVITEAAHCPLLGVRPDCGPHRYSATDMIVQVCLGPAPVGLVETVSAVPRDGHRFHPGSDRAGQLGQR